MNTFGKKPHISAIAAIGTNRELGKDGALIWRTGDDMQHLKSLTMGHPLIMGRKTYDSIGKPLPGRTTIIITRNPKLKCEGCVVVHSLEEALAHAEEIENEEIFIFGGADIYKEALPYTNRLYLTRFHAEDPEADTFFPDYSAFTRVVEKEHRQDANLAYEWITLEREKQNRKDSA